MQSQLSNLWMIMLLLPVLAGAQEGSPAVIDPADKSAVEAAGNNWTVTGAVSMDPVQQARPVSQPGGGVLLGSPGLPAILKKKVSDMRLSLSFMVSAGAKGYVILPGNRKVLLADSRDDVVPGTRTTGFVDGFPLQNAAKAPGLWQTLEISYDVSVQEAPASARINYMKINGVTVQEARYYPGQSVLASPEPVKLEVISGYIAFRDILVQPLESRKPVTLSNLSYKVYTDKWDAREYGQLGHEGVSSVLTQDVHKGLREFHLVYEGQMEAAEPGVYTFSASYTGPVFIWEIDGRTVIRGEGSSSQDTHKGEISLEEGKHDVRLYYAKFPWRAPALGLRVEKPGIRQYDLHDPGSLPEPAPKPYLNVSPGVRPELVRSFVQLEKESSKRTHCLSVGTPHGLNYTVDLNRGALLHIWRGDFADVTDMWYQRGEPQLLLMAGMGVEVSRKSNLAALADPAAIMPDSSAIDFQGYTIKSDGMPEFRYRLGEALVYDLIRASGHSLTRTVRMEAPVKDQTIYLLLGSGKSIVRGKNGLYKIDERYYIRVNGKQNVVIRRKDDTQELLVPVEGAVNCTMWL